MSNESQMTVAVPTELMHLGALAQSFITQLRGGATLMVAVGAALPTLFTEGAQWSEVKDEVKDPQAVVLAGLVLGEMIASFMAKAASAKKALPAAHPAAPAAH